MVSSKIYKLCRSGVSVSSELAKNPGEAPSAVCKRILGVSIEDDNNKENRKPSISKRDEAIEAEKSDSNALEQALECGDWGQARPSELFLRIYHDVLVTLEKNPLIGVCSPSLMGGSGVCPLTIISTVPDISRHMSNVIARAEREVFLATNYWTFSEPSRIIVNGLKELSRKAVERNRKVVVKIIYDRGNLKQAINSHQPVSASDFSDPNGKVRLPHPDEVPNLDIEVMNYHTPIFGTFHAKYCVIDRRIAVVQSNNIQDNDNLEMMTQWEGPIVDSFYDIALLSWHNAMKPPLPCLDSPAKTGNLQSFEHQSHAKLFDSNGKLVEGYQYGCEPDVAGAKLGKIAREGTEMDLPQHTSKDPHFDVDIASEVLRAVSTIKPESGRNRLLSVTRLLNSTDHNADTVGNAPDVEPADMMTPLIPIMQHDPFPVAMVGREPWGAPNHKSVHVPQNAAFSAALQYAKRDVFIQTPNLNAEALLPEILAACRRGVHVTYYYCLGYNDAGELLPFQGGVNEMVAHKLYKDLEQPYHDNLDIYCYVAKDQTKPIHNGQKRRSCHIKLMMADGHIGIQGNGNQDTQSWYHSQETNVLIDSELVCARWAEGIRQNQNTHLYGKVQKEGDEAGCWKDPDTGKQAAGAVGVDPGRFSWAKGVVGAVQRVRGVGGF